MSDLKDRIDLLTLLFSKPDYFIKERLEDRKLREVLETAFPDFSWEEIGKPEFIKNAVQKIEKDYLYLFIGVSKPLASPYESTYYRKDGRLMGKPAKRNIQIMKKWGLKIDESYKDLPDHILTTLNILSVLVSHRENVKEELLKYELTKDINSLTKDKTWLKKFKENIEKNEEAKIYSKFAAALIETFENMERE